MLEEASDVLWLLHQGLEFHAPATLGAFLHVLGECSFESKDVFAQSLTTTGVLGAGTSGSVQGEAHLLSDNYISPTTTITSPRFWARR